MIYFSILLVLIIFSLIEVATSHKNNLLYNIIFFSMAALNALRFGIGSDFFNYMYLYNLYPPLDSPQLLNNDYHGEIGFKVIIAIFKYFNFDYHFFLFVISILLFFNVYIFIKEYSKYKFVSLLMFYVMYYFTYFNSGFRQGFTIIIFLLNIIPFVLEKKYIKFFVTTLILSLFHSSILVVMILPIIQRFINKNTLKILFLLSIVSLLLSIIIRNNIFIFILQQIGLVLNYTEYSLNVFGILFRLLMLLIIIYMYGLCKDSVSENDKTILKFYFVGFCIYIMLSTQDLLASRIHVYFKALEIYIIPKLLFQLKLRDRMIFAVVLIVCIMPIFYVKEIYAQIQQSHLFGVNSVFEYQYISIFDKEKVFNFRIIRNIYEELLR